MKTLEFNKIKELLTSCAISQMGKDVCSNIHPITNIDEIVILQNETSEATTCITKKGSLPLGGISDISPQIRRVSADGILNFGELRKISDFIYVVNKAIKYSQKVGSEPDYPFIDKIFMDIIIVPKLMNEINRCVISDSEIDDNASPELYAIRKEMKGINGKIKQQLNNIIQNADTRVMLQDTVVTLRNDRFCLAVRSEFKNSIKGIVHDQSSTGATAFIEPMSCVELNNKMSELISREQREIEKILAMLSGLVYENKDLLLINKDTLTKLDTIFARGELSLKMDAIEPIMNTNGYTNIIKGRHPLIPKEEVVPTNLYIGDKFSTLLITGPNTGGKTVSLKTLGLFTIMAQSGLHIPCSSGSEMNIYDNIYADIGDEQSIEQSLSTFSSHMTNIVSILGDVKHNNLVLLDELGAGTDPVEGAGLAIAILQYLYEVGATTCVTTHYPELKAYALSTEGVQNASCEFDVVSLKPTYKLLIGIPGKSNAFAISKRLGLDDSIIAQAKEVVADQDIKFEDILTDLEISKREAEKEKEEAERYRQELEQLKEDIAKEKATFKEQKDKIIYSAKAEARKITSDAKILADEIIKEMKQQKKNSTVVDMDKTRQMLQEEIKNTDEEIQKYNDRNKKRVTHNFKKGDKVFINTMKQEGILVTDPDKSGNVSIACGIMKVKLHISNLSYITEDKAKQVNNLPRKTKKSTNKVSKAQHIKAEINILGSTVDEGILEVDKYIDDCIMTGLGTLRIVHGKGTGALRKGIQAHLRRHPDVKKYRDAEYGEGDYGVTIVTLK